MRVLLGSVIVLAVVSSGAEARKVYYEIDGKRYSYSTNNRAATARAKERIAAAKAAKAAKAKADEEISKHPLVKIFGSAAQTEARLAQEKLDRLLAKGTPSINTEVSSPERWANLRDKPKEDRKNARKSKAPPVPASQTTDTALQEPAPTPPTPVAAPVRPPPIAEPAMPSHRTKIRSVSFDVESGIKTIIMIDGAVEEEPFDSSVLAHIAPEQGQANSLVAFVKKLRKVAVDEGADSAPVSAELPAP
ncbi:hypothetical protein [Microvirga makkahensis]|uniref:DUF4124 domain-containing protein n=1 Tax=Microvirga makkahensis TaxID=1128670 RepID=A0A7X3MSW4_9HYPH|nr:hypothetical protein [Microvirga makkahensis]MXQ12607.1 hypothetical protein [Microvirga makkahensis]